MQERPICFGCEHLVEYDPIFEAPCGHDTCSSAVWHGLCLMEWREHRSKVQAGMEAFQRRLMQLAEEHGVQVVEGEGGFGIAF